MKITPTGLLTNGNYSTEALILEARWLLAFRYNYNGRCIEANKTLNNEGRFTIYGLLENWDLYNADAFNRSRRDYYITTRTEFVVWVDEPGEQQS